MAWTRRIIVHGTPMAQPRQRAAMRAGRAMNYTPTKAPVNVYKASIAQAWGEAESQPLEGPVALDVVLVFPRPKRLIWKTRDMPRLRHVTKPDADNVLKAIKDALNRLAWRDDSQVCEVRVEKWTAAGGEGPRTEIWVTGL